MFDSDDESQEIKVRREYENLGYPVNENDSENDDPFVRDAHGFGKDSEMYKSHMENEANDHGVALSYEEACKIIETNANRGLLEIKNDTSSLYTCSYCNLVFTHPKRYLIHYKWHSFGPSKDDIAASANIPKKKRRSKPNDEQVDKKDEEELGEFECDVCNQIYNTKRSLRNHRSRIHFSSPKECGICGKVLPSLSSYRNHMLSHREGKRFMCSQCPKSFKFMHSLQRHIPTHCQEDEKNFPCMQCDKAFGSQLLLKIHSKIHLKPNKDKTFQCSYCPKSFYQGFSLVSHQRIHTGDKPFQCTECDQKYPTNSSLSRHLKVSHSNESSMPYSCQYCGKGFHIRSAWDHHVRRTHYKERPHVCETCGAGYTCQSELAKHNKKHHETVDESMLVGHTVDNVDTPVIKKKRRKKKKEYSDDSG